MLATAVSAAEPRLLYTPSQCAELLNMSRSSLYRLFAQGDLRPISVGPRHIRRITRTEVERFLAARQAEADAGQK
jgi:excisionase family DNA binding protein